LNPNLIRKLQDFKQTFIRFAVLMLFISAISHSNVWAGGKSSMCGEFVGTYLITNFEEDGFIDSRSLITFWGDGNFGFIDSNQGGVPAEFSPFTDAAGSWSCSLKGRKRKVATMVILDFTLPPRTEGSEQQIARIDFFDVTVDRKTGKIKGSAKLRFFPFESNPLDPIDIIENSFVFEGKRVTARPIRNFRP